MEREECKRDYEEKKLDMSIDKCDRCQFKYQCRFMIMAYDEVVEGTD